LFFIPFNRYIMHEANVPYLLLLLISIVIAIKIKEIPQKLFIGGVSISMVLFICYLILRIENNVVSPLDGGDGHIVDIASVIATISLHFILCMVAALIYYNRGDLSLTLWFLVGGYIIIFVLRHSMIYEELKTGYRLSLGYVLYSLIPFLYIKYFNRKVMDIIPYIITFSVAIWLFFLGNRQPVIGLLIFLITMYVWPIITKSKFIFYSTFWLTVTSILTLIVGYVYTIASNAAVAHIVNNISMAIMNRNILSRFNIWFSILSKIQEKFYFGYGTMHSSTLFIAPDVMDMNRATLSSHSLYLELWVRLGLVGLFGYLFIFFNIWIFFWRGRGKRVVKIVGSFLISSLFFSATGQYWIFNVPLQSAFGWIVLGIGVGASLRKEEINPHLNMKTI
jgi:O-antigen ligase